MNTEKNPETNDNLVAVTRQVIEQYNQAGHGLASLWCTGTGRAVGAVNRRFAAMVGQRDMPLLNADLKRSIVQAEERVAQFATKGLDLPAKGTEVVVDKVSQSLLVVLERVSRLADNRVNVTESGECHARKTGNMVALPVARISLSVLTEINQAYDRLGKRLNTEPAAVPA